MSTKKLRTYRIIHVTVCDDVVGIFDGNMDNMYANMLGGHVSVKAVDHADRHFSKCRQQ